MVKISVSVASLPTYCKTSESQTPWEMREVANFTCVYFLKLSRHQHNSQPFKFTHKTLIPGDCMATVVAKLTSTKFLRNGTLISRFSVTNEMVGLTEQVLGQLNSSYWYHVGYPEALLCRREQELPILNLQIEWWMSISQHIIFHPLRPPSSSITLTCSNVRETPEQSVRPHSRRHDYLID